MNLESYHRGFNCENSKIVCLDILLVNSLQTDQTIEEKEKMSLFSQISFFYFSSLFHLGTEEGGLLTKFEKKKMNESEEVNL